MNEKTPTEPVGEIVSDIPPEENSAIPSPAPASKRLRLALFRALAALLIAAALFAITGFSIVDLLRGPAETSAIQNEAEGAFVLREVNTIYGFYADEVSSNGTVTARYALVPMGGQLVSLRLTSRYLEAADTVMLNTYDYLQGIISGRDRYFVVQGTVGKVTEANSALMYDWFGVNKDSLAMLGVIGNSEDYADHLSDHVLIVDTVNGRDQSVVIALSVSAGLFLLYMLAELILMGMGYYLPQTETDPNGEADPIGESTHDAPPDGETTAPGGDDAQDVPPDHVESPSAEEAAPDAPESAPESEGGATNDAAPEATGEDLGGGDAQ